MYPRTFASSRPFTTLFAAVVTAASLAAPPSAATVALRPPHAVLSREKLSAIDDFLNGEITSGKISRHHRPDPAPRPASRFISNASASGTSRSQRR
jgi:hypothetical protein